MLKTPKPAAKRKAPHVSDKVFLNIPYDKEFEPLYLAFIARLSGFGLVPQAVLQITESKRRLDRIFRLMRSCRISFHDLSRVELDRRRPPTPRFNMPFELGLAVAWHWTLGPSHRWYVFEGKARRVQKSLSDLNGTEIFIHGYKPRGVFQELTNVLVKEPHQPTVGELEAIYDDLMKEALQIKKNRRKKSLFRARPFRDLSIKAIRISRAHFVFASDHLAT